MVTKLGRPGHYGRVEKNEAWAHNSKSGTIYYRVKLDDISFTAPIFVSLVQTDEGWKMLFDRNN